MCGCFLVLVIDGWPFLSLLLLLLVHVLTHDLKLTKGELRYQKTYFAQLKKVCRWLDNNTGVKIISYFVFSKMACQLYTQFSYSATDACVCPQKYF
jgi:hypothetical protein